MSVPISHWLLAPGHALARRSSAVASFFNMLVVRYFSGMNASALILTTPRKLGLRVEDFLLLNASGAFDGDGKTELIDGDIYVMNAQFGEHARAKIPARPCHGDVPARNGQ
ncbi:MAG: hypothetical protein K2P79_04680 [Sphingomonas sp.]|nr:hypothetical protein [Sphingomonas sp.]